MTEQMYMNYQEDDYIANYPFDEDFVYVAPIKPKCTCGAAKIGYVEKGPAHYGYCDFYKERQ